MMISHLYVHMAIRVGKTTVASGLFDQLTAVGENKGLGSAVDGRNPINQMGKDDRLPTASGQ